MAGTLSWVQLWYVPLGREESVNSAENDRCSKQTSNQKVSKEAKYDQQWLTEDL